MTQMEREQIQYELAFDRKADTLRNLGLNKHQSKYMMACVGYLTGVLENEYRKMIDDPTGFTPRKHGQSDLRVVLMFMSERPQEVAVNLLATLFRLCLGDPERQLYDATIATAVAEQLEMHMKVVHIKNQARDAGQRAEYKQVFDQLFADKDVWTQRMVNSLAAKMNIETFQEWDEKMSLRIGGYFSRLVFDHMCGGEGKMTTFTRTSGRDGTTVQLSDATFESISYAEMADLVASFARRPMVETPAKFSDCPDLTYGGWYTHPITAVSRSSFGNHWTGDKRNQAVSMGQAKYLDRIAGHAYVINQEVLNAANFIFDTMDLGWQKGDKGFKKITRLSPPTCPVEVITAEWKDSDEGRAYWKEKKGTQYVNRAVASKRAATAASLVVANDCRHEEELYFPVSLDFRGRTYFRTTDLSPQGDTFNKGVLMFKEGKPINLDVMRRFIGSFVTDAKGGISDRDMSKASKAEQIRWVIDNEDKLRQIASDWHGTLEWWSRTDSPFEFLGAVFDYIKAISSDDPSTYISHIICRVDAVASGIQHLGTIARDTGVADAVCLRGQEKSTDLYTKVAETTNDLFRTYRDNPKAWDEWCDDMGKAEDSAVRGYNAQLWSEVILDVGGHRRGDAKPVSMQYSYAVKERTIGIRLMEDEGWRDKVVDGMAAKMGMDKDDLDVRRAVSQLGQFMAHIQFDVIRRIATNLASVMGWYQQCVDILGDHGWQYTNPAGFTMRQRYTNTRTSTLSCPTYNTTIQIPVEGVKSNKQTNGISANQTHSLDGALLVLTHLYFDGSMSIIHDSAGCHSCDMDDMQLALRQAHVKLYEKNLLLEMKEQNEERTGLALPEPPKPGDLDLQDVLKSTYFWS